MLVGSLEGTKEVTKEKWEDNSLIFSTKYGEMFGKEGSIGIIGIKNVTEKHGKSIFLDSTPLVSVLVLTSMLLQNF